MNARKLRAALVFTLTPTLTPTLIPTVILGCLALAACNTVSGFGQDIQDASNTTKGWFSSSSDSPSATKTASASDSQTRGR